MSGRRTRGVALALLPFALSALTASAATDDAGAGRPRTVLVLSGGGSRGLAHVGVLEVLEREHVPLDAVVGTSMGAAVGGLYAAGMTPAQIREMCETLEWDDLFTDRPPRRDISFRRKQDDDKSLWGFELGVGAGGFILPEGLIAGQKLGFAIRSATMSAVGLHEFDDLPTPFRAVATDLRDGSPAVFDHGDLADAIRASMAVPGVFTPVEIDGRDYVDGGLVRNLPVDVGRALGADVIIAVDVSTPPGDAAAGRTVFGVAVQTISLLTDRNVVEQRALLGPRDLLIEPELAGVQATDFGNASGLIARGRRAALDLGPRLRELGVDDAAWEAWTAARRARAAALRGDVRIDRLEVRGVQRVDPRLVLSRMRTRPPAIFDFDVLQADLARIWRIGEFEQLDFRIVPDGDERVLVLEAKEKSWGPNYLRFGTHLEADLAGTGEFTVLADFTRTQFNRLGAECKATATIGDRDSLYGEFYQPFDYSGIGFVAPWGLLQHDRGRLLVDDGRLVDTDDQLALSGLDVGVQFGNDGEIRFGFRRGGLRSRVELATGEDKRLIDLGAWTARATFDLLDNASFPRHGTFARVDAAFSRDALGADDVYDRVEAEFVRAGSFGRHTFVGRLRYGTDLGTDLPFYDPFRLGGFLRLSGLAPDQLQGDVLGYASLIYYRRFAELPRPLGGGVYGGAALEAGNVWLDAADAALDDLRPAVLLFGGIDTILGPVYMGYGRADDGESSFYLFLGRPF